MLADRTGSVLVVLAVICVLAIFFFPAGQGPYPAVHGPVTALLSIRAAAALRWRIVRAGLGALRNRLQRACATLTLFSWIPSSTEEFDIQSLAAGCSSNLRC